MQKWEYAVHRVPSKVTSEDFIKYLNNRGGDRWELICCNQVGRMYELIFKRVKH
jgi:hypothetical protein